MITSGNSTYDLGPVNWSWEFDSADEFIKVACDGKNTAGWNFFDGFDGGRVDRFYETSGREHARKIAYSGYKPGRDAVDRLKAIIEEKIGRKAKSYDCLYDVSGACVDVGVYLSGEPECMISFEEIETDHSQFVDIHFSSGVSASIETRDMIRNGAAVCALVDALEDAGKRVRLTWERSSSTGGVRGQPTCSVFVPLKDYNEPLDIDRLAFFTTTPITRRAMAWSVYSQAPMEVVRTMGLSKFKDIGSSPCDNPKYKAQGFADVWVGAMLATTEQESAEWVINQLKALGVKFESRE